MVNRHNMSHKKTVSSLLPNIGKRSILKSESTTTEILSKELNIKFNKTNYYKKKEVPKAHIISVSKPTTR